MTHVYVEEVDDKNSSTNSSASSMKHLEWRQVVVGGGVRHNLWEIWRGVRANLPLLRGGVFCNISPCEGQFSPAPDNYCMVPYICAVLFGVRVV